MCGSATLRMGDARQLADNTDLAVTVKVLAQALTTALQNNAVVATLQNLVIAVNNLNQTLQGVAPAVQSVASTATAGSNGAVPAQVFEYLNATDPQGNAIKIPVFLP